MGVKFLTPIRTPGFLDAKKTERNWDSGQTVLRYKIYPDLGEGQGSFKQPDNLPWILMLSF